MSTAKKGFIGGFCGCFGVLAAVIVLILIVAVIIGIAASGGSEKKAVVVATAPAQAGQAQASPPTGESPAPVLNTLHSNTVHVRSQKPDPIQQERSGIIVKSSDGRLVVLTLVGPSPWPPYTVTRTGSDWVAADRLIAQLTQGATVTTEDLEANTVHGPILTGVAAMVVALSTNNVSALPITYDAALNKDLEGATVFTRCYFDAEGVRQGKITGIEPEMVVAGKPEYVRIEFDADVGDPACLGAALLDESGTLIGVVTHAGPPYGGYPPVAIGIPESILP